MDEKHLNISTVNVTKNLSVHLIDFTRLLDNGVCENDFICHLFLFLLLKIQKLYYYVIGHIMYILLNSSKHIILCAANCASNEKNTGTSLHVCMK